MIFYIIKEISFHQYNFSLSKRFQYLITARPDEKFLSLFKSKILVKLDSFDEISPTLISFSVNFSWKGYPVDKSKKYFRLYVKCS